MATTRSSAGDPARTLGLLWRDPSAVPRRGPDRRLSVDAVVQTAIDIADREGLRAVTMRRVATDLGAGAMTLYTYVPSRSELLDLMLDSVYAAIERRPATGTGWRARAEAIAEENRDLYLAHPWVCEVSTQRPPLGPGQLAKYEHELAAFDGIGLTDVEMDDCLTYLLTFVQAWAHNTIAARDARNDTGMTDEQWWAIAGPELGRYVDPASFPLASRVGEAAGAAHNSAHDPDHAFEFGLSRVLAGLEVMITGD
ncbi:MAG: TetR/AcrR family transcriptional regulator [Nocardia sp.]|nr:TetR/AcrR family transcriptional regulator [Nocardia sp.]